MPALGRWDRVALGLAIAFLAYLFWRNALLASRVIDGTRYWFLDDDMMISMRYGRNLAEGHGLSWNPGDRVEGYTNFLWVLVMAAVHLTGIADARASIPVTVIGFGLLAASFVLAVRLLRLLAPKSALAAPVLLATMLLCADVVLWSAWGFETSLLTFLNLLFLVRVAERGDDRLAYAALALVPLTRSDGVYVVAANALVALVLSTDPRRTLRFLAAAAVPTGLHFLFRRGYYGDWLPNTYYLKVFGLEDAHARGFHYARSFVLTYAVLLALAVGSAAALLDGRRRGAILFGTLLPTLGYVVLVGGDMFWPFRFFAHVMPVVLVFAAAGMEHLARGALGEAVWSAALLLIGVPLVRPLDKVIGLDPNGLPQDQIQVALLIKKNARPESSVAVIAAGIVPYFTRLRAVDMLGKSDRHLARRKPIAGALVGHGKVDASYTLGKRPDLVVSCRPYTFAPQLTRDTISPDPVTTFLSASSFRDGYLEQPIREDFLVATSAVYTHAASPEAARRRWTSIAVAPP